MQSSTTHNVPPNPAKALAVILSSGGMDSCVTTAIAHQEYRLAMLHVGYGQRTEKRELQAFNAMADFYQAEHRLACRLDHLQRIGGSSLTDSRIAVERADLTRREIPSSYVPFQLQRWPTESRARRYWQLGIGRSRRRDSPLGRRVRVVGRPKN